MTMKYTRHLEGGESLYVIVPRQAPTKMTAEESASLTVTVREGDIVLTGKELREDYREFREGIESGRVVSPDAFEFMQARHRKLIREGKEILTF